MSDLSPELHGELSSQVIYSLLAYPGGILAGTGGGLLRSTDQAQTWQDALRALDLQEPVAILCLAQQSQMVFAGAVGGVLITPDFGDSWAMVLLPTPPASVSALVVSPSFLQDGIVVAGTLEGGVYLSQNGGEHWKAWNFGLEDYHVLALAISPGFGTDHCLYAGTETGLFRSQNGGRSWQAVKLPCGFDAILSLAISPDFIRDQTLLAGSENHGLWLSTDGGQDWVRVAEEMVAEPVNSLVFAPAAGQMKVLAVTGSGVWRSQAPYSAWANCLPEAYVGREPVTVCPLVADDGSFTIAAAFADGSIEIIPIS